MKWVATIPLRLLLSSLVLAVSIGSILMAVVGPPVLALPGMLLIALIVLAAFSRLFPFIALVLSLLSMIAYSVLVATSVIFPSERTTGFVVGVATFMVIGLVAEVVTRATYRLVVDLDRAEALVEELTIRDDLTGAVKANYARKALSEELQRAQRYKRALSVMMIGLDDIDSVPEDFDLEGLFANVGRNLTDRLRTIDQVSFLVNPPRFLCMLPETELHGAIILADRVVDDLRSSTGVKFCSGLASFPDDATDADSLVEEAQSALEFAGMTGAPIAHRDLLQSNI